MIPVYPFPCGDEECGDPLKQTGTQAQLLVGVLGKLLDDLEIRLKICRETLAALQAKAIKYLKFRLTKAYNCFQKVLDKLNTTLENKLTEQQVLINTVAPGITTMMAGDADPEQTAAWGGGASASATEKPDKATEMLVGGTAEGGETWKPMGGGGYYVPDDVVIPLSSAAVSGVEKPAEVAEAGTWKAAETPLEAPAKDQGSLLTLPAAIQQTSTESLNQPQPGANIATVPPGSVATIKYPAKLPAPQLDVQRICIVPCPTPLDDYLAGLVDEPAEPRLAEIPVYEPEPDYEDWEDDWFGNEGD